MAIVTKEEHGITYRKSNDLDVWKIDQIPTDLKGTVREHSAVTRSILSAYGIFCSHNTHLLTVAASERSATHKLAEEIQTRYLSDYWQVDCEYNRKGEAPKRIASINGLDTVTVLPDIIIHSRGSDDNLVVIEAKKDTASKESLESDILKLLAYKNELGYRYAFLIVIGTGANRENKQTPGVFEISKNEDGYSIDELDWQNL